MVGITLESLRLWVASEDSLRAAFSQDISKCCENAQRETGDSPISAFAPQAQAICVNSRQLCRFVLVG